MSDRIKDAKDTELKEAVDEQRDEVFGGEQGAPEDWREKLPSTLDSGKKGPFSTYKEPSVSELLRMTRNKVRIRLS